MRHTATACARIRNGSNVSVGGWVIVDRTLADNAESGPLLLEISWDGGWSGPYRRAAGEALVRRAVQDRGLGQVVEGRSGYRVLRP